MSTSTTSISPMGLALVVEYAFRFLVVGCFGDFGSSLTAGSRARRRPSEYVIVQVSRVETGSEVADKTYSHWNSVSSAASRHCTPVRPDRHK